MTKTERHKVRHFATLLTPSPADGYHLEFRPSIAAHLPAGGENRRMDKKKVEYFKKKLEERQHQLRRNVSRTEQDGRASDLDSAQDIADRAANSYNKEFLFHQSNSERQLLQMVEGALSRIREGTFGNCISCGKDINPKRLEAVPWTRHCIECQEKLEKGQLEEATS
jgi:DnaK suppressor protein